VNIIPLESNLEYLEIFRATVVYHAFFLLSCSFDGTSPSYYIRSCIWILVCSAWHKFSLATSMVIRDSSLFYCTIVRSRIIRFDIFLDYK